MATPRTLPVKADAIPAELRGWPQWVAWRWVWRRGTWTKVPITPLSGAYADPADPATWGTFEQALVRYHRPGLAGIGFAFSSQDPFAGVDLDRCRDAATGDVA